MSPTLKLRACPLSEVKSYSATAYWSVWGGSTISTQPASFSSPEAGARSATQLNRSFHSKSTVRLLYSYLHVNWALNVEVEDFMTVNDEVLDEIIDEVGVLDQIFVVRDGAEGGTETDGQVERIHLSLVTEY